MRVRENEMKKHTGAGHDLERLLCIAVCVLELILFIIDPETACPTRTLPHSAVGPVGESAAAVS